jgi:hemoglobin
MLSGVERPSLYEFAGRRPAFRRLAAAHHQRCLDDPVLSHAFSHPGHPQHVERLADYWAEVLGGPPAYSGACGGQSAMLEMHARTAAQDDLGTRFVECFVKASDDAGLPDDPDFRAALRAYMEWAAADVMTYSPKDATVPSRMPFPAGRGTACRLFLAPCRPDACTPAVSRQVTAGRADVRKSGSLVVSDTGIRKCTSITGLAPGLSEPFCWPLSYDTPGVFLFVR